MTPIYRSAARKGVLRAALLACLITAAPLPLSAQDEMEPPEELPEEKPAVPQLRGGEELPAPPEGSPAVPEGPSGPAAVLQGLDKITARVSTFAAPIDEAVRFGSLEITARTCHKTPPEEAPERAAFLEIVDAQPDAEPVGIFTGWMFSSSPAVSALEHPVYDVWVIDCRKSSTAESGTASGN